MIKIIPLLIMVFGLILLSVLVSGTKAAGDSSSGLKGADQAGYKTDLNYAQVVFVKALKDKNGLWRFDVTVRHNDEGWDHYADAWQIVDPDSGKVLAERILAHPHETEQPFTRSLGGVRIPKGIEEVTVRAKCNVHGFGGREVTIRLSPAGTMR